MGEAIFRITSIEPQKKNRGRLSIHLDGAFAFGLDEEVVLQYHLHEGDALKQGMIDDILLFEEKVRAKEKALSYLSYRARSTRELRIKLQERGFPERTIRLVIEDFLRAGLLDDEKFAQAFAHTRMCQRPVAKRILFHELIQKGIEEESALKAVEDAYNDHTEVGVARDLMNQRMKRYRKDIKARKKLSDFLLRRGFHWGVISELLQEETWDEEQ